MDEARQSLRGLRAIAVQRLTGEEGQGLVEYGLILVLVAVAIVGSLSAFGGTLFSRYLGIVASMPGV